MPEKTYWLILIAGLAIFIAIDFVYIMPLVRDIGVNLFTDAIFAIFTIVFLSWLINHRENLSWKSVKSWVLKRIGRQMFGLFTDLCNLCKCTRGGGVPEGETLDQFRKRIFFIQLEELNEKVELDSVGRKYLVKDTFATLFERREQYLGNIEMKYSKFLDPKLVESLMVIQDILHSLSLSLRTREKMKMFGISDEEHLEKITEMIHTIFREIYKIHKLGIKIYPE